MVLAVQVGAGKFYLGFESARHRQRRRCESFNITC